MLATAIALLAVSILISRSLEDGASYNGPHQVGRDYMATVIAAGRGMDKNLLVNGVGITILTPVTVIPPLVCLHADKIILTNLAKTGIRGQEFHSEPGLSTGCCQSILYDSGEILPGHPACHSLPASF
jgi:hypothetical protein